MLANFKALDNPGLVKIYTVFRHDPDHLIVVYEDLPNGTLTQLMEVRGRLTELEVRCILS